MKFFLLLFYFIDIINSINSNMLKSGIRVTSYNVLSSHLASPSHFSYCKPEILDSNYRFQLLCQKLDKEIEKKSIICLQEVSTDWAGKLYVYFLSKKYYFIPILYGNKFGGYMGVATAFPIDEYHLEKVELPRIADTKYIPQTSNSQTFFEKILTFFKNLFGFTKETEWDKSMSRNNKMVLVQLKERNNDGNSFVIGNYHMPCEFKLPKVMVIHSSLAAQYVQSFSKGLPHILTGDFNFKPDSTMYRILTEGKVEQDNSELPTQLIGDDWKPTLDKPFRSAYKLKYNKEPDFTNNARIKDSEPFIDTLDYIFLSPEWLVEDVEELPSRDIIKGPFPNDIEPSDHILISANLSILKESCSKN